MTESDKSALGSNPARDELVRLLPQLSHYESATDETLSGEEIRLLEQLVTAAGEISPESWAQTVATTPDLLRYRPRLASRYGRYIREREFREADALLDRCEHPRGGFRPDLVGEFGQRAFARVADMFEQIDFSHCQRFVMVGSGPLPVTLLHLLSRTEVPRLVGVDIDERAIRTARRLVEVLGLDRLEMALSDGSSFDFAGADVVYVANLVAPKAAILARIAAVVPPGTPVVLRDPFAVGELFAETGVDQVEPYFEVRSFGPGDTRFLSRHVFLERR